MEPSRRTRRVLGLITVVLAGVGAVWVLRDALPDPAAVLTALHDADGNWLLVATVAELVSMGLFARQQRRLLRAFGVTMARHRALALAYSRSAMAISLPAGSAVSAAYAFRQFRNGGASKTAAGSVMVLSGVLSFAALALLYLTGALASVLVRLGDAWQHHPVVAGWLVTSTVGLLALIGYLAARTVPHHHPHAPARLERRWPVLAEAVRDSAAIAPRHWLLALAAAMGNWLTDLICLGAACLAFDLPISPVELGAIYLTVQLVRQVPLTPGGVGLIEVSLLAGLMSAGAPEAAAAAAVLAYRLLSCWLILPVGLLGWLVLKPRVGPAATAGASAPM